MEKILTSGKGKGEPFKIASRLGFKEPDVFYNFINTLHRDDLIKFAGGKIVINTGMSPVDAEDFLKKFETFLKSGHL